MRQHRAWRYAATVALSVVAVVACSGPDDAGSVISSIEVPGSDTAGGEADAETSSPDAEVVTEAHGGAAADDVVAGEQGDPQSGDDGGATADGSGSAVEVEVDVTVIPDEITPAYVEAVLAELEQLYVDALRALMVAGEPTIEVTDQLGSAFIEQQYAPRLQQFLDLLEAGFPDLADAADLGPRTHTQIELLQVTQDCIFAQTVLDLSGVFVDGRATQVAFVQLGLPDRGVVNNRNPTPWMLHGLPVGNESEMREFRPCDA